MKKAVLKGVLYFFVFSLSCILCANEISMQNGGSAQFDLSYQRPWKIEFDGSFSGKKCGHWAMKRYIYDGDSNSSIDLFETGGFRLGNRKIAFDSARVGKINSPGGKTNHYAKIGNLGGKHCVRIEFDPSAKRCLVFVDEKLKGDFGLEIKSFPNMKKLYFPGFTGKVRVLEGGKVVPGKGGSLSEVIDGENAAGNLDGTTLNADNPGSLEFTAKSKGQIEVTAKLSTFNPAKLSVEITSNGEKRLWLNWERANGTDASPLYQDGNAVSESMFERSPGDMSPNETVLKTSLGKGDMVVLTLEGDFAGGTPVLKYKFLKD